MKTNKFIQSICKFADPKLVMDYPPMEFRGLKKAIEYINAEVKLPQGINHWDKNKIQQYLDTTRQKKNHVEEWIIEKRQFLREPHYKELQEAFFRLQQRWDRKIKAIEKLLNASSF